eukprot:2922289-Prymnesium_polylepis.1
MWRAKQLRIVIEEHDVLEADFLERVEPLAVHRHDNNAHKLDVARARQQRHFADAVASEEVELVRGEAVLPLKCRGRRSSELPNGGQRKLGRAAWSR